MGMVLSFARNPLRSAFFMRASHHTDFVPTVLVEQVTNKPSPLLATAPNWQEWQETLPVNVSSDPITSFGETRQPSFNGSDH
jgi:hypothetical protein